MKKLSYRHTLCASYIGHVTQAIINNFTPLLFLTFSRQYHLPLYAITLLIAINFIIQLLIDIAAATFVDRIGYRKCIVLAHMLCAVGLVFLGVLPNLLSNAFLGILISLVIYALGGGLIEVIIAPIVEACPSQNPNATMSLLHFFYSFGHVAVVIASGLFFVLIGIEHWALLSILWATVPAMNTVYFLFVPIYHLPSDENGGLCIRGLLRSKIFLLFILLMFLSGASEQSMNQWASAFAESALAETSLELYAKPIGDLGGPCLFALMMGISRLLYARFEKKIRLESLMVISAAVCAVCYIAAALSPFAWLKLLSCGLCGLAIGIAWPGIYVLAPKHCNSISTACFALLALGGDLGCAAGPVLVGLVSDGLGGALKLGIAAAAIFPILLLCGIIPLIIHKKADSD